MKNIGKRILSLLCVIVMMLPMIPVAELPLKAEAATEGLDLSAMQIVVPQNATAVENTAATELQNYLYQITGTRPAIKTEGQQSGGSIFIGATTRAKNLKVTYPTAGDVNGEAWAIQVKGSHLILVGAPTRGPLYAVYHLLEDVLGVRWWNPWEEDVPKGNAIVPSNYSASGVPAMEYREVFMGLETGLNEKFNVRNRMNGSHTSISANYGGEETYGWPAHVHTFNRVFGPNDFAAHPEWFSLVNGNRNGDGQLCLTNSGLIEEYAARLVSHVPDDPDGIYSISPNDNENFCQCTNCINEINTYGMSGYVLRFVNKMADAVTAAGYTKAKVEMLVYWAYIDPPKGGVTPVSNVMLRFADNYVDILHGLDHANNADTMSKLQTWISIAPNRVYYWQYAVVYQNNGVLPSMFNYGDDITTLQSMGVNGWFIEQEQCINADFWDMKLWLGAKLMENPVSGAEYTALMDEFIYGYYGEAAGKHIRDYLYLMHGKAEASNVNVTFSTNIIGAEWLTVQDIIAGYDYFEKAVAAAGNNATLQRRIRAARSGFDRVIHENFVTWKKQASNAGLTLSFTQREVGKRIYQTMTEQIALRGIYDPDYPKFYSYYENKYGEAQYALPSEFSNADREHILDYTFEDFRAVNTNNIVADSESLVGKAYCLDTSGMSTLNSTQRAMMKAIVINAYDPSGTTSNDLRTIGSISAKNLTRNSGYKLYSIDWTVPQMGSDPTDYVYLFDDWGLQIPDMKRDLNLLVGQTVKIYLSVKANGSLSSSTYFKGQYYIDRVIVVPNPNQLTHNYVSAPSAYSDGCRVVCNTCGDVITGEHSWDDGVVTKEPTYEAQGVKTYTCTACGETQTESIEKLEKPVSPIDSISSGHLIADRDYSHFATQEGMTAYVDDAEAYGGKAACYSQANLDNGDFVTLHRYESATGSDVGIGNLFKDDLNVGQGYHIYKFTYTVPANATENGVVYIMPNWQLNSAQLCKDLYAYAGKNVEIYVSIKVAKNTTDNLYSVFVDRVVLATVCDDYIGEDGLCSQCGKAMSLTFRADDFELAYYKAGICDSVVEDGASAYGKAARFSYAERLATGDAGLYNEVLCSAEGEKRMYTRADGVSDVQVGQFTGAQLQANAAGGKYVTYEFKKLNLSDVNFVYMFSESLRTRFTAAQKNFLKDRPVDMAVSLRVEGDVTGTDAANPPVYYIDCITFTPSELDEIDRIPDGHLVSMRDSSYFAFDANEGTTYVTDEEAYGGKAVCFTRANLTTDPKISINRYDVASGLGDGAPELKIGELTLSELKVNQGYQIYKFTYDVPVQTTAGNTFYIMSNWQLNSAQFAKDFAPYAGKTVEVYISMKVEGPDTNGLYAVSVDRVALETHCEDYVSDDGCFCTICGKMLVPTPVLSWNLVLDGNIGMNFNLNVTAEEAAAATVDVTVAGETTTKNVADLLVDGKYVLPVELAAAQMADNVTITLHKGGETLTKDYSVRGYADKILNGDYTEETKNLVKYMLSYGAASQTYFGYNDAEENLADKGIEVTPAAVPAEGGVYSVTGSAKGVKYYGATLVYRNKIAVRIYFTGDVTGKTFTVNGETVAPETNGDLHYIEVANIYPQDLAGGITVAVDGLTVTYSAMDYIIRMYAKGGNVAALVQALYGYYLAADAYVA